MKFMTKIKFPQLLCGVQTRLCDAMLLAMAVRIPIPIPILTPIRTAIVMPASCAELMPPLTQQHEVA